MGLSPQFGEKPFGLLHFLAIKSAKIVNDCDVFLYYENALTNNEWWEASKKYCTHIQRKAPNEIYGNVLSHIANKSDVMRLQILNDMGGAYLDIDTISIRPLDKLFTYNFVMGQEKVHGEVLGLCNAIVIGEKNSKFGQLWLEEYKNDYDSRWGYMSVRRSYQLSLKNSSLIHIEPPNSFFRYTWTPEDLTKVHNEINDISDMYILHLWEQVSYHNHLINITIDNIKLIDTTYNLLARKYIE